MRIVATVVGGVNRKITSDRVVTARTKVVTNPPRKEGEHRRERGRNGAEDKRVAQRVAVRSAQYVLEMLGRELEVVREPQRERAHDQAPVYEQDDPGEREAGDKACPAYADAHRWARHG